MSPPHNYLKETAMRLETLAVHAGYSPDPTTKAVAVPIYQTVAYVFDSAQHGAGCGDRSTWHTAAIAPG